LDSNKYNVVLGITGGIAAYKIPELIRILQKSNMDIVPVVTKNACHFVTKTTLATLTGVEPLDDERIFSSTHVPHLSIVEQPSVLVIAPATANIIAKCANGIADDFLSTAFLSFSGPKLIVPAMHTEMYLNPITQENIAKLKKCGVHFLGPGVGDLSCGDEGIGRMVDLDLICKKIQSMFLSQLSLKSKKILISCGGTKEKIDNVRILTNLSSGKLGNELANLASFMGAEVGVVSTVPLDENPHVTDVVYVEDAAEMKKVLEEKIEDYQCLYMAAAVSDFTCKAVSSKIKRADACNLELVGTEDILGTLGKSKGDKTFIGFCLEDDDLEKVALEKMEKKNLDFIVANRSLNIGQKKRSLQIYNKKNKEVVNIKDEPLLTVAHKLLSLIV
jgi:phosphopantothenoylcysteine decarboxylase / phosphopantothenate---cysteine ligase